MAKRQKQRRPKTISYELIPATSEIGQPMYDRLHRLLDLHHRELVQQNVRIALAWATNWKADVDGRLVLGKCKKASDLDRELAPFDFVILLNRDFWLHARIADVQRDALLDHELMHAAIAYDQDGEPKRDDRGRTVFRTRKHDLEEFADIASRYGCWKRDIEEFARALKRAEVNTAFWVSYSKLQATLRSIGIEVPKETLVTWRDEDRREVLLWAQLRQEAEVKRVDVTLSQTMPPCLAAALQPPADASADTTTH